MRGQFVNMNFLRSFNSSSGCMFMVVVPMEAQLLTCFKCSAASKMIFFFKIARHSVPSIFLSYLTSFHVPFRLSGFLKLLTVLFFVFLWSTVHKFKFSYTYVDHFFLKNCNIQNYQTKVFFLLILSLQDFVMLRSQLLTRIQ